ncbi:unnamed protein product [Prunus armeniaca]|uniref:Uncharacterized protein n=1 Tax=Prunus armeniaca TaxID=36596 RepID=A0A6J5TH53_PRUAR|nr:unnamed protein product [Prunus armeniaca]CAB4293119.1 unnamed protein product [Prunus armeniaca]
MRTLLALCVAFSLIFASLQADAKRYNLHERHLAQQKNDPNLQGRSTDEAVASDKKDQSQPQTTNNNNNEAKHDDHDDDDDANESYGKFGHGSSESDSHRYFVDDQFHPH